MRSTPLRDSLRILRGLLLGALLLGLTCAPSPAVQAQAGELLLSAVHAALPAAVTAQAWSATEAGATTELLIVLQTQAALPAALPGVDKAQQVYQTLRQTAQDSQQPLRAWLDARHVDYRAFYIVNALLVRGDRDLLLGLADQPNVARIMTNPRVAIDVEPSASPIDAAAPMATSAIPWGVQRIGAPQVWELGYHGEGVVVAGQDTGYQWDHPALKLQYRGWNGTTVNHDYNWHDAIHDAGGVCPADSVEPCDDNGHGTHTMGTIVGDDGGSNRIGVAPGARWIGCRNMQEGVGTPARYIECFEFFLAPYPADDQSRADPSMAPDVINNSWSCPTREGCDAEHIALLENAVEAVTAAGIMVIASAGNDGSASPYCGTVDESPGMYDASYTVGATDSNDAIAYFSSRGTGSDLTKPDISAPGVNVYSSSPGSSYTSKQGTSMASPHVVGAVALLWSARPDLIGELATTEYLLNTSAITHTSTQCGDAADAVPNSVYGWGRVDARNVITDATNLTLGGLTGSVVDKNGQELADVPVSAHLDTTYTWDAGTDSVGVYTMRPLSGTYTVTASLAGYNPASYAGIRVTAGLTTTLDLTLTWAYTVYLPLFLR